MRVGVRHLSRAEQDALWTRVCTGESLYLYDPRRPHGLAQAGISQLYLQIGAITVEEAARVIRTRTVRRSDKRRWLGRLREIQLVAQDALEQHDRQRAVEILCELLPVALAVEMTSNVFRPPLWGEMAVGLTVDRAAVASWYLSVAPSRLCQADHCLLPSNHSGNCLVGDSMEQALFDVVRYEYARCAIGRYAGYSPTRNEFDQLTEELRLRIEENLHHRCLCQVAASVLYTRAEARARVRISMSSTDYEFAIGLTR